MRRCYACNTNKTHIDNGYHRWYQNKPFDQFLCNNCNRSIIRKEKDRPTRQRQTKRYRKKHFIDLPVRKHNYYIKNKSRILQTQKERRGPNTRIRFGRVSVSLSFVTNKTGICSRCNSKNRKTDMHHWVYIRIFPWFGREELCSKCHLKQTWTDGCIKNPGRKRYDKKLFMKGWITRRQKYGAVGHNIKIVGGS